MPRSDGPARDVSRPDPVVEAYKRDIDRSLLRENLRLTPQARIEKLAAFVRFLSELRRAGAAYR